MVAWTSLARSSGDSEVQPQSGGGRVLHRGSCGREVGGSLTFRPPWQGTVTIQGCAPLLMPSIVSGTWETDIRRAWFLSWHPGLGG